MVNVAGTEGSSRVRSGLGCKRGEGDSNNKRLGDQNMARAASSSEKSKIKKSRMGVRMLEGGWSA